VTEINSGPGTRPGGADTVGNDAESAGAVGETPPPKSPAVTAALLPAITEATPVIADSLGEYLRAWYRRIRGGESGALPIVIGLILIVAIFQIQSTKFLTAANIVSILELAPIFILLGLGETLALLLSEIDLSIGFVAGVGALITAELMATPYFWPWWAAVIIGLLVTAFIGLLQGTLITRLRLPSFIVTLAGLLGWQGVMIWIADIDKAAVGGVVRIPTTNVVFKIVNTNFTPAAGWILLVVIVAAFGLFISVRDGRRRRAGLSAPPRSITVLTIVVVAVASAALVFVCNLNRGTSTFALRGVPYVVVFVLVVLVAYTVMLGRTRFGRYIYAIGANPEAARRAGVNVSFIRTAAFTLCAFTAGLGGLVYASRLGSIGIDINGGTLVLYAVAAAVIGGTSLFGGRGKAVHALLGGLVIAVVYDGLGLLGVSAAGQYMATAVVLLVAVTVDSVVRRRSQT
jgi:D-xylose transport system permease protein